MHPEPGLVRIIDDLELWADRTVTITSGYRCPAYNARIPGAGRRSYHTRLMAADIVIDGLLNERVYNYLDQHYADRCGVGRYSSHTHVDCRDRKARWSVL